MLSKQKEASYNFLENQLNLGNIPQFNDLLNYFLDKTQLRFSNQHEVDEIEKWFNNLVDYNFLPKNICINKVQEIINYNNENILIIFHDGHKEHIILEESPYELELVCRVLALKKSTTFTPKNPFQSFDYNFRRKKLRISFIHASLANGKTHLFIRIPNSKENVSFHLHESIENQIKSWVNDKKNILVCGATGSGKTTFVRYLLKFIDEMENLIILEDTHELYPEHKQLVSLIENNNQKEVFPYILRMTPDRIVLGEMRSKEVVPFILSLSSGHKGMISTIHSDNATSAIKRASLLFSIFHQDNNVNCAIIESILSESIDLVIYIEDKKLKEVIRPINFDKGHLVYETIFNACLSDESYLDVKGSSLSNNNAKIEGHLELHIQ